MNLTVGGGDLIVATAWKELDGEVRVGVAASMEMEMDLELELRGGELASKRGS
jgi:hypothetical protein